ncbi:hypothetical protein ACM40_15780 [Chryseobacterium sp. BLS98]|uniref:hypothetical protein n=1 Tax=Chryseobacterium sp. BLS98 TaxID=885586 RepID=UPI00065AAF8F|nr:hypothetical protein [Chryseobacterium sp. BLS98]KMQ61153.1 hypothetical protein ACM40_15780 [Chryseobacterium sp. BLS98]
MSNLRLINLQFNPFRDITPSLSNNLVWADMKDVKSKISKAYTDCINNSSKQIILNWGAYGGGKTFSAYYFIKEKSTEKNLQHIYIRCPKDGSKATDEFFKSIIDYISFEKLQQHINSIINNHGESALMNFLTPISSREYAKAICLIGSDDQDISELMNRFLYVGLTKTELKKLGLAKDIQTDTDSIKFLAGIISCFIGDGTFYDGRVVFWIDEMEDLIYYASKNYKAFSQVLRDLMDSISTSFLLFMNFTLAEGEESTIELILGGAVWSRVTRKIRYKQFSFENAKDYSLELLEQSRIDKKDKAPFNDDVVDTVLNYIPESALTPREINKHFNSLIAYVIENDAKIIDTSLVNSWIAEYNEDN